MVETIQKAKDRFLVIPYGLRGEAAAFTLEGEVLQSVGKFHGSSSLCCGRKGELPPSSSWFPGPVYREKDNDCEGRTIPYPASLRYPSTTTVFPPENRPQKNGPSCDDPFLRSLCRLLLVVHTIHVLDEHQHLVGVAHSFGIHLVPQ